AASGRISRVYRNNGDNTFEDINAGLEGVYYGSAAWGDYDGDGDLDILLTGFNASLQLISRVYRNNGDDTFTAINAGLEGVGYSSVAWGDYDGDGDLDILLTGSSASDQISRIYRNNGDDTFTAINAGLEEVGFSSVAWGDYDGDGDLDILLTGRNASGQRVSRIYRNNLSENGTTYEVPIAPTNLSSSIDTVNRQVTLTWDAATDNSTPSASLSYNVYIREQGATDYITSPQALEADGWRLLPALGNAQLGTSYTWNFADSLAGKTFEWKVQAIDHGYLGGAFSATESFIPSLPSFEEIPTVLEGVDYSSVSWGDYDGDGDLDILLTGSSSSGLISRVYRNNGDDTFTAINAGLEGVIVSSAAWGDYDGDGDLDILITGRNASGQPISKVYRNNGDDTFTAINAGLEGLWYASVAWGDYDGDGDLDILLTGRNASNQRISRVYRNNGDETFTAIDAGLEGVDFGSVAWGDYDGDGDLDILITGRNASGQPISKVYRNNGDDTFTAINAGLEGVYVSSAAWGDYDGDGDLDILLTGQDASNQPISRVYRNNGDDTFTAINAGLEGVWYASVAWGDYDGDGDLDILLTGLTASNLRISRVYRNNGNETFTAIDAGLEGVDFGSVAWGDYDGDGDLDILLTGRKAGGQGISKIYRNNSVENGTTYAAPSAPTNLATTIDAINKQVTLSWDAATDNSTPSTSLSYNVYVREQGATDYRTSPQALEADGWRLLPAMGNAQLGTSYTWNFADSLAGKTFEWRVQAIDNGYLGGAFSTETSFEILPPKLTLSGTFEIADKVYDGDATAVVSSNALTLDGILLGAEDVTIESIEFSFADKQAGADKEVSITNITLGGTDAGIYMLDLSGAPTATADITPAELVLTGLAAEDKVYDGTTVATLTGTPSITPLGSDVVTVSGTAEGNFAQANVGTAIPVSVSGLSLSGADQGNYTLVLSNLSADITPATLTITVDAGQEKVFGTTDPIFTYVATGFATGDDVSLLSGTLARAAGEDVGTYAITQGSLAANANYSIDFTGADFTITPATITGISFADASFTYDGTEKSLAITGALPTGTTVSYANNGRTDAGTQEVTATITGANYTTLVLTADLTITPATITGITFEDASFTYDGTEKSLAITGALPTGTSVSYANNGRTDVGTQEVTATITGSNYTTLVLTADLMITPATPTLTWEDITATFGAADFSLTPPSSTSTGAFTYSIADTQVAIVTGNTISLRGLGTTTITASQAATTNYTAGTVSITLTVINAGPTAISISRTVFAANQDPNTPVATLSTTDADDTQHTYFLVMGAGDTDNEFFNIIDNGLYLNTAQLQALAGKSSVNIRIRSVDPAGNFFEQTFTLTREAPSVEEVFVPNTITPDGDGKNDAWIIPDLIHLPDVRIIVVDRDGRTIFETRDPSKAWDGLKDMQGASVNKGVYYYIIEIMENGRKRVLNGNVLVL
uniref:FG-GAP-like repeat-containing protein n=1 Tax=Penaeicola halotolerans TaxID=2793196 RepID=UPI001CF83D1D